MLHKFIIPGIKLDLSLYIAEDKFDMELAKSNGVPYICWNKGDDALAKYVLRPFLERMFPGIKWDELLGRRPKYKTEIVMVPGRKKEATNEVVDDSSPIKDNTNEVNGHTFRKDKDGNITRTADVATTYRSFSLDGYNQNRVIDEVPLETFVGDLSSSVNIDTLLQLHLLPQFIGDMADCIRTNILNGHQWREGYNKRRGLIVGNNDVATQKRNLIIADISASIPDGISHTILQLLRTMSTQCNADLIVTGRKSYYWRMEDEFPTPEQMRMMIPRGNEARMFNRILRENIAGHEWGHVFSFGDYDCPTKWSSTKVPLPGTTVEEVHHFHTWARSGRTGYALWTRDLLTKPVEHFDNTWCQFINDKL